MGPLTPRARFAKVISGAMPDKVPLDLGGHQTGIHMKTYKRVLDYLGITHKDIRFYDYLQQLPVPCEEFLERFQIDTRTIHLPNTMVIAGTDLDQDRVGDSIGYWDNFGVFWGRDPATERLYYNDMVNPFAEFTTVEEIRSFNWPKGNDPMKFVGLKEYAKRLYETTEYALIGRSVGSIFQWAHYLFGYQHFMKQMIRQPELITATFDGLLQYCTEFAEAYLGEVGMYIQTVQFTSDLTDQRGPMISPKSYRKYVKPYQEELVKRIKAIAPIKVNFHSCGAASHFIPDMVDIGIDSLNPVQISACDMNPCVLASNYGKKIIFWGGLCNSQKTLPFGTPKEVEMEVAYNMGCLKQSGRYVGSSIHNITYDVPAQNVVAMFDAANRHRRM